MFADWPVVEACDQLARLCIRELDGSAQGRGRDGKRVSGIRECPDISVLIASVNGRIVISYP